MKLPLKKISINNFINGCLLLLIILLTICIINYVVKKTRIIEGLSPPGYTNTGNDSVKVVVDSTSSDVKASTSVRDSNCQTITVKIQGKFNSGTNIPSNTTVYRQNLNNPIGTTVGVIKGGATSFKLKLNKTYPRNVANSGYTWGKPWWSGGFYNSKGDLRNQYNYQIKQYGGRKCYQRQKSNWGNLPFWRCRDCCSDWCFGSAEYYGLYCEGKKYNHWTNYNCSKNIQDPNGNAIGKGYQMIIGKKCGTSQNATILSWITGTTPTGGNIKFKNRSSKTSSNAVENSNYKDLKKQILASNNFNNCDIDNSIESTMTNYIKQKYDKILAETNTANTKKTTAKDKKTIADNSVPKINILSQAIIASGNQKNAYTSKSSADKDKQSVTESKGLIGQLDKISDYVSNILEDKDKIQDNVAAISKDVKGVEISEQQVAANNSETLAYQKNQLASNSNNTAVDSLYKYNQFQIGLSQDKANNFEDQAKKSKEQTIMDNQTTQDELSKYAKFEKEQTIIKKQWDIHDNVNSVKGNLEKTIKDTVNTITSSIKNNLLGLDKVNLDAHENLTKTLQIKTEYIKNSEIKNIVKTVNNTLNTCHNSLVKANEAAIDASNSSVKYKNFLIKQSILKADNFVERCKQYNEDVSQNKLVVDNYLAIYQQMLDASSNSSFILTKIDDIKNSINSISESLLEYIKYDKENANFVIQSFIESIKNDQQRISKTVNDIQGIKNEYERIKGGSEQNELPTPIDPQNYDPNIDIKYSDDGTETIWKTNWEIDPTTGKRIKKVKKEVIKKSVDHEQNNKLAQNLVSMFENVGKSIPDVINLDSADNRRIPDSANIDYHGMDDGPFSDYRPIVNVNFTN